MNHKNRSRRTHYKDSMMITYINIYQDTLDYCSCMNFSVEPPIKYTHDEFPENFLMNILPHDQTAKIIVDNIDSFEMARNMDSHNRVLVLNLASDIRPGGGVIQGAVAQEEDLFRRSNYHQATNEKLYPLATTQAIYSPIVHIIKDTDYALLQKPCQVSCLAIAAIRNPKLVLDTTGNLCYANDVDVVTMQEKINTIFKIAIKHQHHDLILGALGCGVFNNPPKQVATMFKQAIAKYGCYFKTIGFAILTRKPKEDANFQAFQCLLE